MGEIGRQQVMKTALGGFCVCAERETGEYDQEASRYGPPHTKIRPRMKRRCVHSREGSDNLACC